MVTIRDVQVTADEAHALAILIRDDGSLTKRQRSSFANALGRASITNTGTLSMNGERAYALQRALARMPNISTNLERLAGVCGEVVEADPIVSTDGGRRQRA